MRPFHAVAALPLLALPIILATPEGVPATTSSTTTTVSTTTARESLLARASRAAEENRVKEAKRLALIKERKAAALKKKQERARAAQRSATHSSASVPGAKGTAQRYAKSLVPAGQWRCLRDLWEHESGWSTSSTNSSGSAWGIPQALPGSKMAKFGSDWRTNYKTQINWGLHYIENRYGSPCSAWAHYQSHSWY